MKNQSLISTFKRSIFAYKNSKECALTLLLFCHLREMISNSIKPIDKQQSYVKT